MAGTTHRRREHLTALGGDKLGRSVSAIDCNKKSMSNDKQKLRIELYNEDCLKFLQAVHSSSIDLVLIDPPYEVSRSTNFNSGTPKGTDVDRFRISMDFGGWDYGFETMPEVIKACYRVLKQHGTIVCFYDLWKITLLREMFENANFKQIRFIEWIKTNPVPLNSQTNYLTNSREIALTGVKGGKPHFHSEYDNGIYSCPICHDKERFHPTQKPVRLIEELIQKHSNTGDTVLDCFAGSGTTALASYLTGRNFVGCELDSEFYKKSLKRLKDNGVNCIAEASND